MIYLRISLSSLFQKYLGYNVCQLCRASLERERKTNGKDVTDEN